ncbi:MAG: acyltransferase family protein [Aeromicrobium sp.]
MTMRAPRPAGGSGPGGHGPTVEGRASNRQLYVDNLKVVLITAIIAIHAVLGYSTIEVWSYTEVREVTLSPVTEVVLFAATGPFAFFMIALLFLVAGLLTRPSLERKGPAGFVRDRLLRLGLPFMVYVLLVQPSLMYALLHPLGAAPGSYWHQYLGEEGKLDTGPLWFVGVLLIFSLGYAGWAGLRRHRPGRRGLDEIRVRHLWLLAAAVAPASFLVRLVYPAGGESGFTDLNLWEWPACFAAFALGITASRHGWLAAVPDHLRRACRTTTLLAVVAMAGFVLFADALGVFDDLTGGRHWPALVFAAIESVLVVFGPVWLLGVAQRHLNRQFRGGPVLGRTAYGAFMVQTLILIGLAVALRPVPVPAELKALVVASGGVAGSFALAWLLIRHVPGMARIF